MRYSIRAPRHNLADFWCSQRTDAMPYKPDARCGRCRSSDSRHRTWLVIGIIVVVMLFIAVLAACGSSSSVSFPSKDDKYVKVVHTKHPNLDTVSKSELLWAADYTCGHLQQGEHVVNIGVDLKQSPVFSSVNITWSDIGYVMGVAIGAYCPSAMDSGN